MITKFILKLFIPTRWTIISQGDLHGKERSYYSGEWLSQSGRQYVLQNQYGDIKFKTIWTDGKEGER